MSNIVTVAGQSLDIDSLPLQGQQEFIEFFNFLKFKFKQSPLKVQEEPVLSLEEIFSRFQGRLPEDYKFDREEIYEDRV